MTALNQIKLFFEGLDQKQFQRYLIGFCVVVILACVFIIFRSYRATSALRKRMIVTNQKRREVKEILERYESVKKQQAEVDALLAQDKDFKIGGYFNTVIKKLGLQANSTREPEPSREELDNGYTEIKLYASFANMNTQKLTELLDTIEKTERIYTKEVEIYKPDKGATINVNLLIATLEPTTESPGGTE